LKCWLTHKFNDFAKSSGGSNLSEEISHGHEEKAKKMFFDYACNHFFMDHDGLGVKYRKYGVTKKQEIEWRSEYISIWTSRLSVDDLTPVNRLRDAWADEALPDLMKLAHKGDGYAKLWYANAIWQIANRPNVSAAMRKQAISTAINLWKLLVQDSEKISDDHRANISPSNIFALGASTPEEYVVNYTKSQLAEANKKSFM
jgi:hypothetical protein